MATIVMPKTKLPLDQAEDKDLQYWLGRKIQDVESGNGKPEFLESDKRFIAAVQAEILRRKGAGGQASAPATNGSAAKPPAANGKAQSKPKPSTGLAVRGSDTLAGSFSDAKAANEALRKATEDYILISPATHCGMLPPGTGVALSVVYVDTTKVGDKYPAGDVSPVSGKLQVSANVLKKIAAAAAIDWDPKESGRVDDHSDPGYCHYLAVGWVKNFDGTKRRVTGEADIDARPGGSAEVEIRIKAAARAKRYPAEENDGGDSQLLELRKFLLRHCQTKAKNRAVVDLGVKRSYTIEELQKPFAIARLMWTGQTDDPELKRDFALKLMDSMMGASQALYGGQVATAAPPAALAAPRHAPPPLDSFGGNPSYIDSPADEEPALQQEESDSTELPDAQTQGNGAEPTGQTESKPVPAATAPAGKPAAPANPASQQSLPTTRRTSNPDADDLSDLPT